MSRIPPRDFDWRASLEYQDLWEQVHATLRHALVHHAMRPGRVAWLTTQTLENSGIHNPLEPYL